MKDSTIFFFFMLRDVVVTKNTIYRLEVGEKLCELYNEKNHPVLVLNINKLDSNLGEIVPKKFTHSTVYCISCNYVLAQNENGCVNIIRYIIFFILF